MPIARIQPRPPRPRDAALSLRTGVLALRRPSPLSHASSTRVDSTGPGAMAPASLSCLRHTPRRAGASSVCMGKPCLLPPGMSQASPRHPAAAAMPGPRRCVTDRREAGERLERARAALGFPLRSEPSAAARKALEARARCQEAPPGWAPPSRLPSPPPHRHTTAQCRTGTGGQALSKAPSPFQRVWCWGDDRGAAEEPPRWGAGMSSGMPAHGRGRIWDHQGQRPELEGEASPLAGCASPRDAQLGSRRCRVPVPPPCLCSFPSGNQRSACSRGSPAKPQGGQHPWPFAGGQRAPPAHPGPCPSIAPSPCSLLPLPHLSPSQESSPSPQRVLFSLCFQLIQGGKRALKFLFGSPPHLRPPRCAQGWERAGSA